jgi:hypothetical protein
MEVIAGYLMRPRPLHHASGEQPVLRFPALDETQRQSLLSRYMRSQASPMRPTEKAPIPSKVARPEPTPQVISPLGESPYWFYISYAQVDSDSYLKGFYDDLSMLVQPILSRLHSGADCLILGLRKYRHLLRSEAT